MRLAAFALALGVFLFSVVARAEATPCEPGAPDAPSDPPFAYPRFVRTFVGFGRATQLPADDVNANLVLTSEIGGHPLTGALGTGFSLSSAEDFRGLWSVVTPGIFAELDLTYLFLSGLWACDPPRDFPFRLQLGGRLGLGVSQSFRGSDVPSESHYVLVRTELQEFFDVEVPIGRDRVYSLVLRGATDNAVNLSDTFRWSFSIGVNYGWGHE